MKKLCRMPSCEEDQKLGRRLAKYPDDVLAQIHETWTATLIYKLRRKGLLNREDLQEVVSDAYVQLVAAVKKGISPEMPVRFLWTVAECKRIDLLRRCGYPVSDNANRVLAIGIAGILLGTDFGLKRNWRELALQPHHRRMLQELVSSLPPCLRRAIEACRDQVRDTGPKIDWPLIRAHCRAGGKEPRCNGRQQWHRNCVKEAIDRLRTELLARLGELDYSYYFDENGFRRRRGRRFRNNTDVIETKMEGSPEGAKTQFMGSLEYEKLRYILRKTIEAMPERERLVSRHFLEDYEYYDAHPKDVFGPLTEAVAEDLLPGEMLTKDQVKWAWRKAREKIRNELKRHGYGFLEDEDGQAA